MKYKTLNFFILNILFLNISLITQCSSKVDFPAYNKDSYHVLSSQNSIIILEDDATAIVGIACFQSPCRSEIIIDGEVDCRLAEHKLDSFTNDKISITKPTHSSPAPTINAAAEPEVYHVRKGTTIFGTINPNAQITFQGKGSATIGVAHFSCTFEELMKDYKKHQGTAQKFTGSNQFNPQVMLQMIPEMSSRK